MAKFGGMVGFIDVVELSPGVWGERAIERPYFGDVIRSVRRFEGSDRINENVNISNEISIISDTYATMNLHLMRYVEFEGVRWKINSIEIVHPRLILSIGGVYNGTTVETSGNA